MASISRIFAQAVRKNICSNGLSRNVGQKQMLLILSRCMSVEAAVQEMSPPQLDNQDKVYDPKIVSLVSDISQLTLKEVTDLNELLRTTLNIQDAPVFAHAGFAAPAPQAANNEDDSGGSKEQTEFNVKLVSFEASDKIKVIKAVKALKPELNLVQAKRFVESVPTLIQEDVSKEEAEELRKSLEDAGAKVEIS